MKFKDYDIPENVKYHNEHCWVKLEADDLAVVGWTDFAQQLAGELTSVFIPEEGEAIVKDKYMGSIESGKWVGKLYGPVTGEILETNWDVNDDPREINKDPYGNGWIMKVKLTDPSEVSQLLDAKGYTEVMEAKLKELGK